MNAYVLYKDTVIQTKKMYPTPLDWERQTPAMLYNTHFAEMAAIHFSWSFLLRRQPKHTHRISQTA